MMVDGAQSTAVSRKATLLIIWVSASTVLHPLDAQALLDIPDPHPSRDSYRRDHQALREDCVVDQQLKNSQRSGACGVDGLCTALIPAAAIQHGADPLVSGVVTVVEPVADDHQTPYSSRPRIIRTSSLPCGLAKREIGVA